MPKRRAASRWLSPSTWQAWRTRAYSSTAFILTLPAVRTGRKIRRRLFTPPPRPDTPAASVRDFLSAAYIRVWRAFDPVARRTLAWELGGRDDATCRRLLDKVGIDGHVVVTDDWEGFQRPSPAEQLFTGKDLTFPIEQDNSNIRHHLARFRRRSKVTSRTRH